MANYLRIRLNRAPGDAEFGLVKPWTGEKKFSSYKIPEKLLLLKVEQDVCLNFKVDPNATYNRKQY